MRLLCILLSLLLFSCGNKELSDEQRKEIRENLKERKPVRIRDEQLIAKSFEMARASWRDTTNSNIKWKVFSSEPENPIWKSLWEAYEYSFEEGTIADDNVQLDDTVIFYSRPIHSDTTFNGMATLTIPKRTVVLEISED